MVKRVKTTSFIYIGLTVAVLVFTGCRSPQLKPLMPTPILFTELNVGPLDQVPAHKQSTPRRVYYVTTRARARNRQHIQYGNAEGQQALAGLALVSFGEPNMRWDYLLRASRERLRDREIYLSINGVLEAGPLTAHTSTDEMEINGATTWLLSDINNSITAANDKDIMIYVHGAKVNFYNACVFAAQLDHFMGRDMTSVAFSWPSRQNIFAYGFGGDVSRAYTSSAALADLIELLAQHTEARRIHIVCWSAGGRVVTRAMTTLQDRYQHIDADKLQGVFRLGTLYFAASDVPREEFIAALPVLDDVARRIVVSASEHDGALEKATLLMGGGTRIGQISDSLTPEDKRVVLESENLEVVDVSRGSVERGFNITGHSYWFDHPWASSDVILSIRSDLDPEERGLVGSENGVLWWMPADYPARLRESMLRPELEIRR